MVTHPSERKPVELEKPPQVGDIVSVWSRDSKRHKWKLDYGFCLVHYIDGDDVSVQTSDSFNHHNNSSCTGFCLRGHGTWERKLCKPTFTQKPKLRNLK